jgi:Ni/Fe-hydrogenase 1 B-type cytochrome subunit
MSAQSTHQTHVEPAVYVYEAPIRLWHWIQFFAVATLCVTGFFIGHPLPSQPGEAYNHFLMGYIRFAHFTAAYIFIIGFLFRIYWAFVGNSHAREIFLPPIFRSTYWRGVWHEIKWYLFLTREPNKYSGHNPLAILAMHVMFVWGSIFIMLTGLALFGEGTQEGSWQYDWFSSWITPLFGQPQDVRTWHHLAMWYLVCFILVHIYVAIREDIMSRQSIVSSMISGWRTFKDSRHVKGDEF